MRTPQRSAFVQDGLDLGAELAEVAFDNRPDDVEVDVEVAVGEDIAHPDNLAPGHLGWFSRRSGVMRAAASPMIWS